MLEQTVSYTVAGNSRGPVTGTGPLARRYATENHGLTAGYIAAGPRYYSTHVAPDGYIEPCAACTAHRPGGRLFCPVCKTECQALRNWERRWS